MITFSINKPYINIFLMRNNIFDVSSVLTVNGFNVYTIIEIVNSKAFPIILGFGSLVLTTILILVQIRKYKYVKNQIRTELLEQEKIKLEITKLKAIPDVKTDVKARHIKGETKVKPHDESTSSK